MRWSQIECLQKGGKVLAVLVDAARRIGPLAARMAASVVGQNTERFSEAGQDECPAGRVAPGPVDKGKRFATALELVVEPDAIDLHLGHGRARYCKPNHENPFALLLSRESGSRAYPKAEGEGFEPPAPVNPGQRFSRPSTLTRIWLADAQSDSFGAPWEHIREHLSSHGSVKGCNTPGNDLSNASVFAFRRRLSRLDARP
jgi:hypothetical protein